MKRPELPPMTAWLSQSSSQLEAERQAIKSLPAFPQAVRRLKDITSEEAVDALRRKAINRWLEVIRIAPEASATGRLMISMIGLFLSDSKVHDFLDNVLARRPPATLLKRAVEVLKFAEYCKSKGLKPFPFEETVVYDYMDWLKLQPGTAATKLLSVRQSIQFAGYILRFDGVQNIRNSQGIDGMVFKKLLEKRILKQSKVFTVNLLISIMILIDHGENELNTLFLCHILFCVFARSRWTDHAHISRLEVDEDPDGIFFGGYMCGETLRAKTSISAQQRRMFLPLTAVLWTFLPPGTKKWWNEMMRLRESFGLEVKEGAPFFPAPAIHGGFCKRPLTAGEATSWLREILRSHSLPCEGLTSHGCKATLLSWCAKQGVEPAVRLLLGYHVGASSNTLLHYSRDALAGPLARLNDVVRQVVLGRFRPDLPRSQYFPAPSEQARCPAAKRPKLNVWQNTQSGPVSVSSDDDGFGDDVKLELPDRDHGAESSEPGPPVESEPLAGDADQPEQVSKEWLEAQRCKDFAVVSSSDDSSDAASDDSEAEACQASSSQQLPRKQAFHGSDVLFVHKRTATLHKGHTILSDRLACGRMLLPVFRSIPSLDSQWARCKICFGSVP